MPCAANSYSCNSLITIRSPFGEVRLGAPTSASPSPWPVWSLARAYILARETVEHRRQRQALAMLDRRLLRDVGLSEADAAATSVLPAMLRTLSRAAKWLARERLRHEGRTVDPRILEHFAISNPEAARELRKLLNL